MSYVIIRHSYLALQIKGRNKVAGKGGKAFIPSITEWQKRVLAIHRSAKEGCPFAMEFIRDLEKMLFDMHRIVDRYRKTIEEKTAMSLIQGIDSRHNKRGVELRISLDSYIPMAAYFLECLAKTDHWISEYREAGKNGIVDSRRWTGFLEKVQSDVRALKHKPFRYRDDGVRSLEYRGTLEWDLAVKRLGREPRTKPYHPKFFLLSRVIEKKAIPPALSVVDDVSVVESAM